MNCEAKGSNLKDIRHYCEQHQIEYYTTIDFLKIAIDRNFISPFDAAEFVKIVREKGSKLPDWEN